MTEQIIISIASATAAFFSAFSSFFILLTHRKNLHESQRPEIVFINTQEHLKQDIGQIETLEIKELLNIGRGVAYRVFITLSPDDNKEKPKALYMYSKTAIKKTLAQGEKWENVGKIMIFWENIEKNFGNTGKYFQLDISIEYFDRQNWKYKSKYSFVLIKQTQRVLAELNGPLLEMKKRKLWKLKFERSLSRIPFLRNISRKW